MLEHYHVNLHQAVLHRISCALVHPVFTARSEKVSFLDFVGPNTLSDTNHPKELVYVIARVSQKTSKDDEDIVNLVLAHNLVADFLTGTHRLTDSGNVSVVPRVVVHQSRSVSHATNLVAIIPPRHDFGVLLGVLSQPLVRLTVVIDDVLRTIRHAAGKDNRRRRVGIGCNPGAVSDKHQKVDGHAGHNGHLGECTEDADVRCVAAAKTARLCRLLLLASSFGRSLGFRWVGALDCQKGVQDLGRCNGSSNTDNGCQCQHKTDHDSSEVAAKERVDDNKDVFIIELAEAKVNPCWEEPDEHVKIKEECWPSRRLVLRDRSNDGDVDLGVASVPQGVETAAPGRNVSKGGETHEADDTDTKGYNQKGDQKRLELLARDSRAHIVNESHELEEAKDAQSRHVLRSLDRQKANKGNLHTSKRSKSIPRGVAHIKTSAVSSHADQHKRMHG